jgi:hypothetical protein
MYLWQVPKIEEGDAWRIADETVRAGFNHVLIKIAGGAYAYNDNEPTTKLVELLRARGIFVWGWHYIYGDYPAQEAAIAARRVHELALDGYVIDAESEFKEEGKAVAAKAFMAKLRAGLSGVPIALSTYRFPSYHPAFPFAEFLAQCDYNMPQVYWMEATNAGEQLRQCVDEYRQIAPERPIIPTGAAFSERGWSAQPGEVIDFLDTARALGLSGANFWEWENCRRLLPGVWDVISRYSWTVTNVEPEPVPEPERVEVTAWRLNVRTSPAVVSGNVIGAVAQKTKLDVAGEQSGDWVPVRAWVHKDHVKPCV